MKTAIALFAVIGMTTMQAYAAPAVDPTSLSGVPMNVATHRNAALTADTASLTVERSGLPMHVAARANQAVQAPQAVAVNNTGIRLSGVRMCHAKRT